MGMYAALSDRGRCSQVLFLGILSPHIYLISLKLLATGVGMTCSTAVDYRHASFGAKVVALHLHRQQSDGTMDTILIFLVYKRRFSQRYIVGFAWVVWVWNSPRSQKTPPRPVYRLPLATTNLGPPFENWRRGTQSNVSAVYRILVSQFSQFP